jgi:hypothetical protein
MQTGEVTMANQVAQGALAFARNGANRPLHQDRQILRASDLALEQATQDAMLARARRYLHGWGVVAGFLPEVSESSVLTIGPGYGVTPFGDELFLPEPVALPSAADVTVMCCGPGPTGCEIIDPEALAAARRLAATVTVTSFLVARPASRDAAPRSGVPEDCTHPGAVLLPSRRCGGVEFAILCTLPPSHVPQKRSCEALMPFVCGGLRGTPPEPLPWELLPGPEANLLVIAELSVTGDLLTATIGQRRTLWPVSLIQDWIASCLCPMLARETLPRDGGLTPGGNDTVLRPDRNPPPTASGGSGPRILTTGSRGEPVVLADDAVAQLRDRLSGNVTDIPGIGDVRARMLARVGVTTEGGFLTTPPAPLAAALNLPESTIVEMKEELNARHRLGLAFG